MNPLGNGTVGGLPPQLMQTIQQIKPLMQIYNGNINQLAQQNSAVNQILQTYKGQNPEQIVRNLCKQRGIDPDALIRALRN